MFVKIWATSVVYFSTTLCTPQPNPLPPPPKKVTLKKNFFSFLEIELCSSSIKKTLHFLKKKLFLCFLKKNFSCISINGTLHFSAQVQKNKRNCTLRKFLILQKMEKPPIFFVSGNRNSKKAGHILGGNLQWLKIKNIYILFLIKEQSFQNQNAFFIIITEHFLSFFNIFSIFNKIFFFCRTRDFCNIHDKWLLLSLSPLERF